MATYEFNSSIVDHGDIWNYPQWNKGDRIRVRGLGSGSFSAQYTAVGMNTTVSVSPTVNSSYVESTIPSSLTALGRDIIMYLYKTPSGSGATVYVTTIHVKRRAEPSSTTYTEPNVFNYQL